jgi:formyltetrahydrofolate-dependent phosphoribosylglycinamide formyltransferase
MTMMGVDRPRVAVLGSTQGSSLVPVLQEWKGGRLPVELALVISNKRDSGILQKAREAGVEAVHLAVAGRDRDAYDAAVTELLEQYAVDWVLLIGWMRLFSETFVRRWWGRVVNVHPSLLPRHGGLMDLEVHRSVLESGDPESGCTLHLVSEEVDGGPVLLQRRVPVFPDDTPDSLKARVQAQEGQAFLDFLGDPGGMAHRCKSF